MSSDYHAAGGCNHLHRITYNDMSAARDADSVGTHNYH